MDVMLIVSPVITLLQPLNDVLYTQPMGSAGKNTIVQYYYVPVYPKCNMMRPDNKSEDD